MPENPRIGIPQSRRYDIPPRPQFAMPQNPQFAMPQNPEFGNPQIRTAELQAGAVGYIPGETVMVTQPTIMVAPTYTGGNDNMAVSILSCLFCFWPVGLVAVVMSCMSSTAFENGDQEEGRKYGKTAGWLALTSFLLGLAVIVISVGVVVGIANSSHYHSDSDY